MVINYNGSRRVMVPLLTIMTTTSYYTACLKVKHCTRKEGCLSPGFTAAQIKHLSCQDIWEGTNTNFKYGKRDVLQTCLNVTSNKIIRKIHLFLLYAMHLYAFCIQMEKNDVLGWSSSISYRILLFWLFIFADHLLGNSTQPNGAKYCCKWRIYRNGPA